MSLQTDSNALGNVSAVNKVAIIVALLGETNAQPILEKLDPASLADVRAALANLSLMPRETVAKVVINFLTHLRGNASELFGGRVMAHDTVARIMDTRLTEMTENETLGEVQTPVEERNVWEQMAEKPPQQIATYFASLTPNLIAKIMRKLPNTLSSEVIALLVDEQMEPVLSALIQPDEEDAQLDAILEQLIKEEFLTAEEAVDEDDETHLESVGEILSLIPSDKRDSLFGFLQREHEAKLVSIQKSLFTLEDLPEILPRETIPTIFREIDMARMVEILVAIQADVEPTAEFLLSNISSRMADQYKDEIASAAKPNAEQGEILVREFLSKLLVLKRNGLISVNVKAAAAAAA